MKKHEIGNLLRALCLTAVVIAFIVILYNRVLIKDSYDDSLVLLKGGWTVEYRGEIQENVNLLQFKFPPLSKGEDITISCELPNVSINNPAVRILTYHSTVSGSVDGVEIYRYGDEPAEKEKLVGSGYHYMELPDTFANQVLKITLHITEDGAFSNFTPILLADEKELYLDFIHDNTLVIFTSVFLIMIGVIFLCITSFLIFYTRHMVNLLYISLFSVFIGIWTSCNYKILQLISDDLPLNTLLEYISIYLLPLIMVLYFHSVRKARKNEKKVYFLFVLLNLGFVLTALFLHFTNILHLPKLLYVCHIIIVVEILYTVISIFRNLKNEVRAEKMLLVGLVIFFIVAIMDLLQYNFQKYNVDSFRQGYLSITPVGAVVLVIFLFVSYLVEIYDTHNEERENEYLIKMAYYDYLTQTGNRAKCNLWMQELNNETVSYGIISMDLNDLKKANDSKGHNFGDLLICGLSNVLKRTFEPDGMVGRMGGDEFIVILKSVSKEKIDELIKNFKWNLEIENDKNPELQLRVSYGYAMDYEIDEKDAGKVYNLADARMYQMKEIYHRIQECWDKNLEL